MDRQRHRAGTIDILLVESNPDDARLFTDSSGDATVRTAIRGVSHDDAFEFVRHRGEHAVGPDPDIVFSTFNGQERRAQIFSRR